jgi:hypothetical protein
MSLREALHSGAVTGYLAMSRLTIVKNRYKSISTLFIVPHNVIDNKMVDPRIQAQIPMCTS